MPISEKDLRACLESGFEDAVIQIKDLAGDNDHWEATVISPLFEGKSRIEQHRMVQEAVKGHDIHALSVKTRTP